MSPKAFNAVRGVATNGELLLAVTDEDVVVLRTESVVGGQFVRDNRTALGNEMLNDGNEGGSLGVSHLFRHLVGVRLLLNLASLGVHIFRLPHHRHTEDGSLRLGATPLSLLRLLALVLVGFPTAEVHFVALHHTRKGDILLCEQGANLVENEPRRLLRNGNVRSQLNGRNALLVATDEVHSEEPLAKRNLRVLKDGSDGDGEVRLAVTAMEPSVSTAHAMVVSAMGANHIFLVPTGLKDSLTALFLGGEVSGEFKYGVEAVEVNHNPKFLVIITIIYLKLRFLFQIVQTFFA